MLRFIQFSSSLLLLLGCISVWALVPVPKLLSHVTDMTATLSSEQISALDSRLLAFEKQKGSQIAILIVPTTQPEVIEQFSIRVADTWKLGRKNIDDGVIIIVAKEDRKLRIEVGYGLEGAIPDAIAKRITSETITPRFKAGDFAGGLEAGVEQLIKVIEGEPLPPPTATESTTQINDGLFLTILLGGIVGGWILSAFFGRSTGSTLAALGSGGVAALLLGIGVALFIALMVFFFVGARSSGGGGWTSGGGYGGYGGGYGGSYGGGGSWGGGGGGGGGGFGGGGASDSW